jgi:RNA polymerase sigma-70 factor (ECF subfamily)
MLRLRKATPVDEIEDPLANEANRAGSSPELDEWARVALRGDLTALRQFLLQAAPIVRRVCGGVMGRESPDLEDTIQDCLIDLARALPHFRFEGSASHYVAKIAIRRAIGSRRRARARWQQQNALASIHPRPTSFDGSAEVRADMVRTLLEELNEEQTKALLLRIMVGHSIDEIATITGVSVNTVKTRLRLAKNRLRGWILRSGEGRRGSR